MRILQIRFKNLNSLAGEWLIDLAHPDFAASGIFAITGPTGAGKTTILDAICLALYGRTPRLGKITRSGNEIMSRQLGECFAEAAFETQAGRFRCHWSQHRARKKPGGVLQAPKHEIADADSGKILGEKIIDVAEHIETVTGMDFDRFTRSMLLAQGGFAAFLAASPDERAPILEQITGTEIYSRISIRVHEIRSEVRKKLEVLEVELAGMELLTGEDEQQLRGTLDLKAGEEVWLIERIDAGTAAAAWLDRMTLLESELKKLEEDNQNLQARRKAFQPEQEKLARAERALELAGEYAALVSLRGEQKSDLRSIEELRRTLPEIEKQAGRSEEALKLAGRNLEQKKADLKEAQPILRKVRDLDLKLLEKEAPIKAAEGSIAGKEAALDKLRARQEKDSRILDERKADLGEVLEYLSENSEDEALVEEFTGIRGRFEALHELEKGRNAGLTELTDSESRMKEAVRLWKERIAASQICAKELETVRAALNERLEEHGKILSGRETDEWREILSELNERRALLDKTGESLDALAEARRSLVNLDRGEKNLSSEKDSLDERIAVQEEQHAACEKEMQLLVTQLALIQKIRGFDEVRGQLRDGEPCPLCGAEKHPFADGNIPAREKTAEALDLARAAEKEASRILADFRIRRAGVLKELEQVAAQRNETAARITAEDIRSREGFSALDPGAEHAESEMGEALLRLRREIDAERDRTAEIVKAAVRCEKEVDIARKALEKTGESAARSDREARDAVHEKDSSEQAVNRKKIELEEVAARLRKAMEEAEQRVSRFGFENLTAESLDQVLLQLTSRRDRWTERQKQETELAKNVSLLELQTGNQKREIDGTESELKELREKLAILADERKKLTLQRIDLFGDGNPDDEEARLTTAVEEGEKHLERTRRENDTAVRNLGDHKARIEALEKAVKTREAQLKTGEETFHASLGRFGFAGEDDYRTACLPEQERENLVRRARELVTGQAELDARNRDKPDALDAER